MPRSWAAARSPLLLDLGTNARKAAALVRDRSRSSTIRIELPKMTRREAWNQDRLHSNEAHWVGLPGRQFMLVRQTGPSARC